MMYARGRRWIPYLIPVVAFVPVYLVYLYTHPYPALGGGLYLMMAEEVARNGYVLPARIPYYTTGGIPFAYPPLMFYVAGLVLDAGVPRLSFARLFPVVPVSLSLVSYYAFSRDVLGSSRGAMLSAILVGTTPAVLEYTISAGGFVRAMGLLFATVGLATGLKTFTDHSWHYTVASTILFGAVVLTHPKYALFFGTSYLVFYLWYDRTVPGLLRGAAVAVGGVALASPWWVLVGTRHGFDVFSLAGTTHGGIGSLFWAIRFLEPHSTYLPSLWPFLVAIGGVYLVARREYFLPFWFLTIGFVVGNDEHLMIVGALIASTFVFDAVVPSLSSRVRTPAANTSLSSIAVVLFVASISVYAVASAAFFVESGLPSEDEYVSFIDDDDVEAMTWANQETPQDSSFVVIGDVAEWFPLFSHRTSSVAARGSEWSSETNYSHMLELRSELGRCLSSGCLTETIEENDLNPDYVYVARDGYEPGNNRVLMEERWTYLVASLVESNRYRLVFENDGAVVFEYDPEGERARRPP